MASVFFFMGKLMIRHDDESMDFEVFHGFPQDVQIQLTQVLC